MTVLSRQADIPRGPAFFARKADAAIVPSFLLREGRHDYRLVFHDPIYADGRSEEELMEEYMGIVADNIRKYPDQWYLFTKYWL